MEKTSWNDRVRNDEVLRRDKEERNILRKREKRKVNWIGHILRRNCLLQQVIEGKIKELIEVAGRRSKQLLNNLKEKTGYWKLETEALDRTVWRTGFGIDYGPVVRQTTE